MALPARSSPPEAPHHQNLGEIAGRPDQVAHGQKRILALLWGRSKGHGRNGGLPGLHPVNCTILIPGNGPLDGEWGYIAWQNRIFLKLCRTVHSWLGILVFPWVIIIGLTGVYLNHSQLIYSFFSGPEFSESQFTEKPFTELDSRKKAQSIAEKAWPNQPTIKIWEELYHGRSSVHVKRPEGLTVLSIPTGHYYLKTRYTRRTFSPDDKLLHTKYYWGAVFKDLHRTDWLGRGPGTWIADAVGVIMVIFGITGSIMWMAFRFKRFRSLLLNR
jgi:hypothetical protein